MSPTRYVLFANGEIQNINSLLTQLHPNDQVIAVDGGAKYCRALGLTPHVLIGDLDSVAPNELAQLEAQHTRIVKHPRRKDQTDLELAIDLALSEGASEVLIYGALGGRWDQTLANLLLPALAKFNNATIRLIDDTQTLALIRGEATLRWHGRAGETVSLIALTPTVQGVSTTGLEYPLHEGVLHLGSTLGISNVMVADEASVSVREGLVMCILITNVER